ncbi:MAG: zinc metallopeptidase [Clostridia bacterium]|nr:zinc metallopeptidase [Clostridia bacterium]
MPFFYMDYWYFVLVLPALLVTVWAQIRVKSVFNKYSRVSVACGMTGAQTSEYIQQANGVRTSLRAIDGAMTDYYDPRNNCISLSAPVFSHSTVAAVGVAAHETGHAIQHARGYVPVRLRTALVPVTNFASSISPLLVVLGIVMSMEPLAYAGIILFSVAVFFQLVTLPVEFNASARAVGALQDSGKFTPEEIKGVRRVLTAAALTYVAALFVSLMSLLRLILLVSGSRGRRR